MNKQMTLKMEKDIKVSIIMAVYNVEKYLDESIQSVLNQTLKEFDRLFRGLSDTELKSIAHIVSKRSMETKFTLWEHMGS